MSTVCLHTFPLGGSRPFGIWHFTSRSRSGRKESRTRPKTGERRTDPSLALPHPIRVENWVKNLLDMSRSSYPTHAEQVAHPLGHRSNLANLWSTRGKWHILHPPSPHPLHQVCSFFVQTPHRTKSTEHWGRRNGRGRHRWEVWVPDPRPSSTTTSRCTR